SLAGRPTFSRRAVAAAIAGVAVWTTGFSAIILSSSVPGPRRLSSLFAVHSVLLAAGYLAAAVESFRAARPGRGLGPALLAAALGLLTILFSFYCWATSYTLRHGQLVAAFLYYSTFLDVLLQFFAAFAMLVCRTEHDQMRLTEVNRGLETAHRELANTYALLRDESERDALTDAYNRTALRRFLTEGATRFGQGCVALIDMNSLKSINDRHGPEAAPRAIRLLADAIRGPFRADDPLFRWGGDEFLLLLSTNDSVDASRRLSGLNNLLAASWDGGPPGPQASWGIATYSSPAN